MDQQQEVTNRAIKFARRIDAGGFLVALALGIIGIFQLIGAASSDSGVVFVGGIMTIFAAVTIYVAMTFAAHVLRLMVVRVDQAANQRP